MSTPGLAPRSNGLPTQITADQLLLVEGKDECAFFNKWLPQITTSTVQIIEIGGKDNFNKRFPIIVKLNGFRDVKRLGFIRDAEDDAKGAFDSFKEILIRNRLTSASAAGTVQSDDLPHLGIWIMPDNRSPGSIETLCWNLIPQDDQRRTCTESFIECLRTTLPPNSLPKRIEKTKVQAYLGSRDKPLRETGRAAQAGVWDFTHGQLNNLREFLVNLFQIR